MFCLLEVAIPLLLWADMRNIFKPITQGISTTFQLNDEPSYVDCWCCHTLSDRRDRGGSSLVMIQAVAGLWSRPRRRPTNNLLEKQLTPYGPAHVRLDNDKSPMAYLTGRETIFRVLPLGRSSCFSKGKRSWWCSHFHSTSALPLYSSPPSASILHGILTASFIGTTCFLKQWISPWWKKNLKMYFTYQYRASLDIWYTFRFLLSSEATKVNGSRLSSPCTKVICSCLFLS